MNSVHALYFLGDGFQPLNATAFQQPLLHIAPPCLQSAHPAVRKCRGTQDYNRLWYPWEMINEIRGFRV